MGRENNIEDKEVTRRLDEIRLAVGASRAQIDLTGGDITNIRELNALLDPFSCLLVDKGGRYSPIFATTLSGNTQRATRANGGRCISPFAKLYGR